ncbi:MAG: hypothetical protein S4CHLAM45_08530 [Chlamydiales bacterium]|nr:hypothetical protein [Chlamydiales bacterium]MCH9620397.1 hypothetical protein [Chlamydiales bacterium]MCH9622957.1 hypothetical protein [Chlamydiales bacterium]
MTEINQPLGGGQNPITPETGPTTKAELNVAKDKLKKDVDMLHVLFLAFYESIKMHQNTAQTYAKMMQVTQDVTSDANKLLSGYNYVNLSASMKTSSWDAKFADINIANDRIQAQINIVQNKITMSEQISQTQQSSASAGVQNAAQALQEGAAALKEISRLTDMIASIGG